MASELVVTILSWNVFGAERRNPPRDPLVVSAFLAPATSSDIFVVGTQENYDKRSVVDPGDPRGRRKKMHISRNEQWCAILEQRPELSEFTRLIVAHLRGVHLVVYAKNTVLEYVSPIRCAEESICRVGVSWRGCKGGVGIALRIADLRFLFVAAHLTPNEGAKESRDQDYHRLLLRLEDWEKECQARVDGDSGPLPDDGQESMEEPPRPRPGVEVATANLDSVGTLFDTYSVIVIFGDLNYRIGSDRKTVLQAVADSRLEDLRDFDELTQSRRDKSAFSEFDEAPVTFPPTYKFRPKTTRYDRHRVPSWTDRILYRINVDDESVSQGVVFERYQCQEETRWSDHLPILGAFRLSNLVV